LSSPCKESSVPRMRGAEVPDTGGGYLVRDTTYRFIPVKPECFFVCTEGMGQ